jgi:hypothetical protein
MTFKDSILQISYFNEFDKGIKYIKVYLIMPGKPVEKKLCLK